MAPFTLKPNHWYALESLHALTREPDRFLPMCVLDIRPLKRGRGLLRLHIRTLSEHHHFEGKVLQREGEQMTIAFKLQGASNVAIVRDISLDWLKTRHPGLLQQRPWPPWRVTRQTLNAYLDWVLRDTAPVALFAEYGREQVIFRCRGFGRAEAEGLPLVVTGENLLALRQAAVDAVRRFFPDWPDPQNRTVLDVDWLTKSNILSACALRFDGYAYLEDQEEDAAAVISDYIRRGEIPDDTVLKMAMFFHLQRYLMKWGGEFEHPKGKAWRLFNTLFFEVVNEPVPPRYQHADLYFRWLMNYEPHRRQCIEAVRRVHEATMYDDDAAYTAEELQAMGFVIKKAEADED